MDTVYEEEAPTPAEDEWVLAVEYLPGQFDQRADSCAQCIQLSTCKERPEVRTARLYYIRGELSAADRGKIRAALINPVEAREASLDKPATIRQDFAKPAPVAVLSGFHDLDEAGLARMIEEYGLAMDLGDIRFCQEYFRRGGALPHNDGTAAHRHLLVGSLPPYHLWHDPHRGGDCAGLCPKEL